MNAEHQMGEKIERKFTEPYRKGKKMATPRGLEPQLSGPKPLVLPLHHGVAKSYNYNAYFLFV